MNQANPQPLDSSSSVQPAQVASDPHALIEELTQALKASEVKRTAAEMELESRRADSAQLERISAIITKAMPHFTSAAGSPADHAESAISALFRRDEFTLADALEAFPVLRDKPLSGIKAFPDRRPFIGDAVAFVNSAHSHGSGAFQLAMILCELTGTSYGRGSKTFDWSLAVGKLDSEHTAALAFVLARFVRNGGF